jgi:hypothetical protein
MMISIISSFFLNLLNVTLNFPSGFFRKVEKIKFISISHFAKGFVAVRSACFNIYHATSYDLPGCAAAGVDIFRKRPRPKQGTGGEPCMQVVADRPRSGLTDSAVGRAEGKERVQTLMLLPPPHPQLRQPDKPFKHAPGLESLAPYVCVPSAGSAANSKCQQEVIPKLTTDCKAMG